MTIPDWACTVALVFLGTGSAYALGFRHGFSQARDIAAPVLRAVIAQAKSEKDAAS
jgi:hypothetical protein